METIAGELSEILESMDVPQMRKQLRPEDIAWLRRNLAVNNADHEKFSRAIELVKKLS